MLNDYYDSLLNCYSLLEKISELEPGTNEHRYAVNTLLIITYSSFEQFNKRLLIGIKKKIASNHRYIPIIINNTVSEENFVAPTRSDVLLHDFPLLKRSYFYCEYKGSVDTLIFGRNNFAHKGEHTVTVDNIKASILNIQYIVRFLYKFYIDERNKDEGELINFLTVEYELVKNLENAISNMENIVQISDGAIPSKIIEKIETLNKCIVKYNDYSERLDSSDSRLNISLVNIDEINIYSSSDIILNKLKEIKKMIVMQSIYKEPTELIDLSDLKECIKRSWNGNSFI